MKQRFITLVLIISFLMGFGMLISADERSNNGKTTDKIKKEDKTKSNSDKTTESTKQANVSSTTSKNTEVTEQSSKKKINDSKENKNKQSTKAYKREYIYKGKIPNYDPEKEPPFNKKEIESLVDSLPNPENSQSILVGITDNFIEKNRFKAAEYAFAYLKKQYPKYYYEKYDHQDTDCLIKIQLGKQKEGEDCMWDFYINQIKKYDAENLKKKYSQTVKEFDYFFSTYYLNTYHGFKFSVADYYSIDRITYVLEKYKDLKDDERSELVKRQNAIEKHQLRRNKRKQLIEFRRKQIDEYLRELERLLVLKDEQKLREFFEKYAEPKRVDFMVFKYRKFYFDRNFTKITFKVVPGSTNQKYPIKGYINDDVSIHCEIKTIPNTKDSDCPQRINTDSGYQYCRTFFRFKLQNKILIAY